MDFKVTDHGTVWTIEAVSPEAIAFAQDDIVVADWQGTAESFTADHRVARALVERLASEGWRIA